MEVVRAFQLEWLKIRHYRIFWVLLVMYLLALIVISSGGGLFLEWLKSKGVDFNGINPTILPIYDFPDIWQNITWLSAFFKLFPAFIIIISVNNDITYNTLRQNIIDGLSKQEYMLSKLSFVIFLALASTMVLFLTGLIAGLTYSKVLEFSFILMDLEFLGAFFLEIVVFCSLAFLLALVIKKSGFVIVSLFLYTLMFEPILAGILGHFPPIKSYTEGLVDFLPAYSIYHLIDMPFPRYFFQEIQDFIAIKSLLIVLGWFVIYVLLIRGHLLRKDLK